MLHANDYTGQLRLVLHRLTIERRSMKLYGNCFFSRQFSLLFLRAAVRPAVSVCGTACSNRRYDTPNNTAMFTAAYIRLCVLSTCYVNDKL